MNMTTERFRQILAAYGSRESAWPAHEREEARAFLQQNAEATTWLKAEEPLDNVLSEHTVADIPGLQEKVLAQTLPSRLGLLDQVLGWLLPAQTRINHLLWRPALAASLPLVFGLYLGAQLEPDIYAMETVSVPLEEELYLLSLHDYAENNPWF